MRAPGSTNHTFNPLKTTSFLDDCAFDPKCSPEETEAARQILELSGTHAVGVLLAHSVQGEIEHPRTPGTVKTAAAGMFYTISTSLTRTEQAKKRAIHAILTGNANPARHEADATHVFEASKYGGCFITTDGRILGKAAELWRVCRVRVVKPSAWLAAYRQCKDASQETPSK